MTSLKKQPAKLYSQQNTMKIHLVVCIKRTGRIVDIHECGNTGLGNISFILNRATGVHPVASIKRTPAKLRIHRCGFLELPLELVNTQNDRYGLSPKMKFGNFAPGHPSAIMHRKLLERWVWYAISHKQLHAFLPSPPVAIRLNYANRILMPAQLLPLLSQSDVPMLIVNDTKPKS